MNAIDILCTIVLGGAILLVFVVFILSFIEVGKQIGFFKGIKKRKRKRGRWSR